MSDMLRVRITRTGDPKSNPEWWQFRFEDADTGRMLPVTDYEIVGGYHNGHESLMAKITIYVHEIDVEMPMQVTEVVVP